MSDLLLSLVTLKWGGVPAREAIYKFVDRLNSELTRKNDLDKDFVLKACLAVTGLPLKYEVKNFTSEKLARVESQWDAIKLAIESGVDLVNTFGIDKENLTSQNALIPVIYFLYQRLKIRHLRMCCRSPIESVAHFWRSLYSLMKPLGERWRITKIIFFRLIASRKATWRSTDSRAQTWTALST